MEEQTTQNQTQTPPTPGQAPQGADKDIQENKTIAYLSYLGILFLVPMLVKKESKFAQFHAKQGLILTIAWFLGSFLYVFMGLGALIHLVLIIFSIMGLINVSKGEMKDLPVVGDIAKKFNI